VIDLEQPFRNHGVHDIKLSGDALEALQLVPGESWGAAILDENPEIKVQSLSPSHYLRVAFPFL